MPIFPVIAVPEIRVAEYGNTMFSNDNIRFAGELLEVFSITNSLVPYIRYVIDKIREMDQPIRHLAGFCVAKLYNAKNESDSYYESKFRRDMAAGKLQLCSNTFN